MFFDKKPKINLAVVFLLFLAIAFSPKLDIWVSSLFFSDGRFVFYSNHIFQLIDKGMPEFLAVLSVLIFVIWFWGLLHKKKWLCKIDTKAMLLTFGSMIVGPVIITNGIFKSFWGRARPKDIVEFGGDKDFSPAMVISNQCNWDCSFFSGHTAVGFWVVSLALLAPQKYRKTAVCGAFLFGALFGLARIAQGYHFFTDVFFSAVVNIYTVWVIYYLTYKKSYDKQGIVL